MAGAKSLAKTFWIGLALGLAIAAMPTGSARGQVDPRRLGSADLPARVKAIVGLPHTLDAQNCVTWGGWEVCFGSQLPIAKMYTEDPGLEPLLIVHPLRCKNPAIGERECVMRWNPWSVFDRLPHCAIHGWGVPSEPRPIQIRCPSGLVLE